MPDDSPARPAPPNPERDPTSAPESSPSTRNQSPGEGSTAPGDPGDDAFGTAFQSPQEQKQALSRSAPNSIPKPNVPGYELLECLGRGGMGIVYLANQVLANRLVALKMILDSGQVSETERKRFRIEGEAMARMKHVNIAQVFEVNEREDGTPYFAMEYCSGGNLAEFLAHKPQPPMLAAVIAEALARGVQHAHEADILHRDLKPGNVLIAMPIRKAAESASEGSKKSGSHASATGRSFTPDLLKITDFGLAKRLDAEGMTYTQAVMGTPSYMSPEQAAGQTKGAGAGTDIWSVGVILYEMLTGDVPFKGESVLETMEMVRWTDPVPPSKVRPGIPRDLETICLKAMAKDPKARYLSALAMCQDLERFRAGEPILGRRVGPLLKLLRRAGRNKAIAVAAMTLAVSVAAVAFVLVADSRSSKERRAAEARVYEAKSRIDKSLEAADWDVAAAEAVEADIARLAALDETAGGDARKQLLKNFASSIRNELKTKERVLLSEVPGIETRIAWIAGRDAGLAEGVAADLKSRLRSWLTDDDLAPPFADGPTIRTRFSSLGVLRVTVDFAGAWYSRNEVGLTVGSRPDAPFASASGYAFVLRPAWPKGDPEAPAKAGLPPSFEASGGAATLELLRDGSILEQKSVQVASGRIRLTAEREGDRLSISLDGSEAAPFDDPVPLTVSADSTIVLLAPVGAEVRRLHVERQVLPPAASRLEKADEMHALGKYADAATAYEAFGRETTDAKVRAEASCKAGLCLVQLGRTGEAAKLFEKVATESSERWGVISAFQLWLIRLKEKAFDEADAALSLIKVRFPREVIARNVPVAIRNEIDSQFAIPSINWLVYDPRLVGKIEATQGLAEVLQLRNRALQGQVFSLSFAHGLAGDYAKSREVADGNLNALLEMGHHPGGGETPLWIVRWHAWMGRLTGKSESYDDRLAKHLALPLQPGEDGKSRLRTFLPLRLENARNLAPSGRWDAVEKQLDTYIAEFPAPNTNYAFYSQPRFMKGFVRLKLGDEPGALAAWKSGTYATFVESLPPTNRTTDPLPPSRKALAEAWAMAALTDTLSDEDAARIFKSLASSFGSDETFNQVANSLNISPSVTRGAWTSPRGREWARRMAFLDLSPAEYFWTAPRLLIYEKLRQDLFDGKATAEMDDAVWLATVQLTEAFRKGQLSKPQLLQLALSWKGTTNFLGWGGLAPKLDPSLRAPLALALGFQYRRLKKPADSLAAFETAAADAPEGSTLRKLAQEAMAAPK